MSDAIKIRSNHIFMSDEGYYFDSLDYSYLSLKIGYTLIREIDYSNLEFNQKLAGMFYKKISSLELWWTNNSNKTGYLDIPLLKMFSMYLNRYIMTNMAIAEGELDDLKVDHISQYKQIIQNLLANLFNLISTDEIEHFLAIVMKCTVRVLGFNDEIRSDKWVYYGIEISMIPKITCDKLSYYFSDP
jgi:hypothetical protein